MCFQQSRFNEIEKKNPSKMHLIRYVSPQKFLTHLELWIIVCIVIFFGFKNLSTKQHSLFSFAYIIYMRTSNTVKKNIKDRLGFLLDASPRWGYNIKCSLLLVFSIFFIFSKGITNTHQFFYFFNANTCIVEKSWINFFYDFVVESSSSLMLHFNCL
jgi:hypothetical protein